MPGTSYWQKGVDFAKQGIQKSSDLSPTDIHRMWTAGKITAQQAASYGKGYKFGHEQFMKELRSIEDGKLARSQQSDSVRSESKD